MILGNLNVDGRVLAAPMAGISSGPYRRLARRFGAAIVYTEMISSNGLVYQNARTEYLLRFNEEERPIGFQLFGADPNIMHRAAAFVSRWNPDLIDLNFGCPVKKVVRKNGGAAVLKDLGLLRELVAAAASATNLPVTAKLRSGWDETNKVFLEAGRIAQDAGAVAITLHARSRSRLFSGQACWEDIRRLKEVVSIPVIGNGDIACGADARRMLDETACDAVMVGRAATGNPWIFQQINDYLETGNDLKEPMLNEIIEVILEHARLLMEDEGECRAILKMRGILPKYTRGWPNAADLRRQATRIGDYNSLRQLLSEYLNFSSEAYRYASGPA